MMRHKFAVGTLAVAFAFSAAPGFAQDPPASRPAGGAERAGTATPRSDGGSAAPRGGGEVSMPRGGSGMSGGSSMGSSSSPSAPSSSGMSGEAPRRAPLSPGIDAAENSQQRAPARRGGEATGRTAVPRGGTASGGDRGGTSAPAGGTTGATASGERTSGSERRAVPTYSRPRDGRTVTGEATERRGLPPGNTNIFFYSRPYYSPYGFWGSGFGYGLGYLYYDPFWYGGYGYPYYGGGYYGGGYYGGGYGGSGSYGQAYRETGAVRLRVRPREAQVYVDGYYVGMVDDFDGTFQRLTLEAGPRRIEIRAEGYETETIEVLVTPGETLTYRGELKPIR